MFSKIIADFLVLIHLSFICFVVLGGLLVLKYPRLAFVHIPAAIWGILIEFKDWYCPLTQWENHFRFSANQEGYPDGFIDHYIIPLIYPSGLTDEIQIVLGVFVLVVNLLIYSYVVKNKLQKVKKNSSTF